VNNDEFHIEDGPEKGNLLGFNQEQKILEFQLDFFRQQMKIKNYKEKVKNLQTLLNDVFPLSNKLRVKNFDRKQLNVPSRSRPSSINIKEKL